MELVELLPVVVAFTGLLLRNEQRFKRIERKVDEIQRKLKGES